MQSKKPNRQRSSLCPDLLVQLDPQNHLFGLAKVLPWQAFEDKFRPLYAASGRPGKPVRLTVGLLILKQLENLSDERVVDAWGQSPYLLAFCGQQRFTWKLPCGPSELSYFRRRVGEDGVRKIFEVSVALHGGKAKETEDVVNSTVQDKGIAFPTGAMLLTKIVTRCHTMVKLEDVKLRRSYQRESLRAVMRLRTIASILVRELKRKLSLESLVIHQQVLDLYDCVQRQQRSDSAKIYSLHEPGLSRISKGRGHKKYKFDAKASVTVTKISGIIVGALSFRASLFDGHTLPVVLSQVESIVGQRPTMAICERGYRGKRKVGVTSIEIPESGRRTKAASDTRQVRVRFRRRAINEPIIGHLINNHRMLRNYLRGLIGDSVKLFIACTAFNFWKFIRILCFLCHKFLGHILRSNVQPVQACA